MVITAIGDKNLLQKKIIKNPRYEDVASKIDTGASITRHLKRVEDIQNNFKIKPNEIFKRIKLSSFTELLLETAMTEHVNKLELNMNRGVEGEGRADDKEAGSGSPQVFRNYTTLSDVVTGVGNNELYSNGNGDHNGNVISSPGHGLLSSSSNMSVSPTNFSSSEMPYENCAFLLLDTQQSNHFEKCHIRPAINFDPAELSRTVNPYNKTLLKFINKPNKIIVVYDQNEDTAVRVCKNLAERDVQNVYLLSGGLKLIANRGLHVLVTGPYPRKIFSEEIAKAERTRIGGRAKRFTVPGFKNVEDPDRRDFLEGELSMLGRELDRYMNETVVPSTARSHTSVSSRSVRSSAGSSRVWR